MIPTLPIAFPASVLAVAIVLLAVGFAMDAGCSAAPAPVDRPVLRVSAGIRRFIDMDAHGFVIAGRRSILLAGTVQYQRIDRSDWDRVLQLFEASGFNTVDVYVQWNEHEPVEGQFDFHSGDLDLAHFLNLCNKRHLWVVLRPGPYICNECDGGGLPAWLYTKPGLELRQDNPAYLACVRRYLHEVDRIANPFQITRGGPIILYQIENELDFWGVTDRTGYMKALRDFVREDGLDIPIIGCVGSGNHISQATGDVPDVWPTHNLYVSRDVEAAARDSAAANERYDGPSGQSLAGVPVYVSETDRNPLILRRLIAGGSKGVSPFNYAGGINWGRSNGTTHWGSSTPISTAIDFQGMIGYDCQPRARWTEAKRFADAVNQFSQQLAEADSAESGPDTFSASNRALGSEDRKEGGGLFALHHGSSWWLFLLNNSDKAQDTKVTCQAAVFPQKTHLVIAPYSDPILPVEITLQPWGSPAVLDYATAEVRRIERTSHGVRITLGAYPESGVEASVSLPGQGQSVIGAWPAGGPRGGALDLPGARIEIVVSEDTAPVMPAGIKMPIDRWSVADLSTAHLFDPGAFRRLEGETAGAPGSMEHAGILRGAAWYRKILNIADPADYQSLRLDAASGLITAYLNGECLGFVRGVGDPVELSLGHALKAGDNMLLIRVEIWGHANFGDASPPVNRIGSLRGLLGPVSLEGAAQQVITGLWELAPDQIDHSVIELLPAAATVTQGGAERAPLASGATAGEFCRLVASLSDSLRHAPEGVDLQFQARNVLIYAYLDGQLLGRCVFGPEPPIKMVGGPADVLYIPASWLKGRGALSLVVEGLAPGWALDGVQASALPAQAN